MADSLQNVSLLQKCSPGDLIKLFHGCIDGFCGRKGPDFDDYKKIWIQNEFLATCRILTAFARDCIGKKWTKEQAMDFLADLNCDSRDVLWDGVSDRKDEIFAALVKSTADISPAYMTDFDWKVKLVLSSSKVASLHEPITAVDFSLVKDGKPAKLSLEMSKAELEKMISALEAASDVASQWGM